MQKKIPTILVVEDEKTLLKTWAQKFKQEGLEVLTAQDGEAALKVALQNHPDLIVLDLVMPSTDGLMFIKKLREDKWGNRVAVTFLNSWRDPESFSKQEPKEYHIDQNWGLDQVVQSIAGKLEVMKLGLA